MQRGDLVVEGLAALVEAAQRLRQRVLDEGGVDFLHLRGARGDVELLQQVQKLPGVAVGVGGQEFIDALAQLQAGQFGQRALHQLAELVGRQRFQDVDLGARQQRADDFERGVFRGGADEGEQPRFNVGQKRVLLRLVEAVDFVHEQNGGAGQRLIHARTLDRLADVLDAGQHGRYRDEVGAEGLRGEPRQRGLAHARRPPQDHRMQLAGIEGQAQRLARAQQMRLADDIVQRARAQALGQRGVGVVARGLWGVGLEKVLGGHRRQLSDRTPMPL